MRTTMTVTALTAALLVSTAAYAETASVSADASIEALPKSGAVSLTGTVDRVVDADTFILRDASGETIDVHTKGELSLNKGDMVSISGNKKAELAGIGKEIEGATVDVKSKASATAKSTVDTAMAKTESPKEAKANTEAKKTAAYDMDADIQIQTDADVKQVAEAGEMTAKEATAKVGATADATAKETTGLLGNVTNVATSATDSVIDNLPKEGSVELTGTVDRVSSDDRFILRDSAGETIDVHTASAVDVEAGDKVSVSGNVKSELLGLGREIEGAKVLVVSASAQ